MRRSWRGSSTPTVPRPSATGANVWNTALLIGWDEPGGTYDHVPPGPVTPPNPAAPLGESRLRVRTLRLPRPGRHRLTLDRPRLGLQRRIPPHLTDRDTAQDLEPRRPVDAARRGRAHLRAGFSRETPRSPRHVDNHHRSCRTRVDNGPRGRRQWPQQRSARAWDPPCSLWRKNMGVELPAELNERDATLTPGPCSPVATWDRRALLSAPRTRPAHITVDRAWFMCP